MDEVLYKQTIKEARRLANQIVFRQEVIDKATAERDAMETLRARLVAKTKAYEEEHGL